MSDPRFALLQALHGRLLADPAVSNRVTGVFDPPPRAVGHPFITFGELQSKPLDGDDPPTLEHRLDIIVHSRAHNRREVSDLAERARVLLDDAGLGLSGHRLISIAHRETEIVPSRDRRSYRARVRFRILTVAD